MTMTRCISFYWLLFKMRYLFWSSPNILCECCDLILVAFKYSRHMYGNAHWRRNIISRKRARSQVTWVLPWWMKFMFVMFDREWRIVGVLIAPAILDFWKPVNLCQTALGLKFLTKVFTCEINPTKHQCQGHRERMWIFTTFLLVEKTHFLIIKMATYITKKHQRLGIYFVTLGLTFYTICRLITNNSAAKLPVGERIKVIR